MINLDDTPAVIKLQGGEKVIDSIDGLGKQLAQAWKESQAITIPESYKNVSAIVVCGMGGSRFPALIIKELFKKHLKVPIEIQDNYFPPAWVGENTLVILSSYSGTTEEVLASGAAAYHQGAKKLLGITTGGDVAAFLKEKGAPCYVFEPTHNPSAQPRIGVGYMLGGLLGLIATLGLIDLDLSDVDRAIENLGALLWTNKIGVETSKNKAKQMALMIVDHYPYYIVSEFLTGAGNAIQNQTNETAKSIASYRVISELNHHLMEGLKHPKAHTEIALFIFFSSQLLSGPMQKRFQITREVVEKNNIKTLWHELAGKTEIEQIFELLGFGGYLTMYLSALYGEDPTAIPYVDYFKKKLKEV